LDDDGQKDEQTSERCDYPAIEKVKERSSTGLWFANRPAVHVAQ